MLKDFPSEIGVPRGKKEAAKLEGFYSEKAQALDKLLALDKAAKQAACASKPKVPVYPLPPRVGIFERAVDALRRSRRKLTEVGSELLDSQFARSMTFAVPVLTVLAAIALGLIVIASWRVAPPTTSIQFARESTDVAVPKAEGADIALPAHAVGSEPREVASEPPARAEVNVPAVVDRPLPEKPARGIAAIPSVNRSQQARVSSVGDLKVSKVSEAQPVATSLQARLGAPVDEPSPPQLTQPARVATPSPGPPIVRRPIDSPSEPLEAAPIAVAPRPTDPTPAIRDVLHRYEAAYERLDASAAKDIWPTVDERALAKAFAGLASQTLRLEPCNIAVTGSSAVASCHGFATYVGRVGNKAGQVQRRDWTFELRKSTDNWQIRSVRSN
jgi:hypothetical protein